MRKWKLESEHEDAGENEFVSGRGRECDGEGEGGSESEGRNRNVGECEWK